MVERRGRSCEMQQLGLPVVVVRYKSPFLQQGPLLTATGEARGGQDAAGSERAGPGRTRLEVQTLKYYEKSIGYTQTHTAAVWCVPLPALRVPLVHSLYSNKNHFRQRTVAPGEGNKYEIKTAV